MSRYLSDENIIDLMCKACDKIEVVVDEPPNGFIKASTSYSVDGVPMWYIAMDVISLVNFNEILTRKLADISNTLDTALMRSDNMIGLLTDVKKIVNEVKRGL